MPICLLDAAPERPGHRLRPSTREHRAVNRDRLTTAWSHSASSSYAVRSLRGRAVRSTQSWASSSGPRSFAARKVIGRSRSQILPGAWGIPQALRARGRPRRQATARRTPSAPSTPGVPNDPPRQARCRSPGLRLPARTPDYRVSRTTYLGPLISFIQLPRRRLLNHRQSTFRRRYAHRSIPSADR